MLTDPVFYAAAAVSILFLGLGKGGFSGVGVAATPFLALFIPPVQAAAIILPILLLQDVVSVWVYRRDWDPWNLKVLLPGSIVGVGAGWLLATYVSDAHLRLVLGAIALVFVLNAWVGGAAKAAPRRPGWFSGMFWGAGSGFTSMISHAGAPPFFMHVLPQKLDRINFAATAAVFFAIVNVLKVGPYFMLGGFSTENLLTSAVLAPFAIATNFLGIWLVRITPNELFYRIAYIIVFLLSLELLRSGIMGLWNGAA